VGGLVIGVHKVFAFIWCYATLVSNHLPEQRNRGKTSNTPRLKSEIAHMYKTCAVLKYSAFYLGSIHEFVTDEQEESKGARSVTF
jgi:Na+/melibiose symporter-like transporter